MCRLIVATGDFDPNAVLDAAYAMSRGTTAAHTHPLKQHLHGWGAMWKLADDDSIHRCREAVAMPPEPSLEIGRPAFLAVHVRDSTNPAYVDLEHTHPIELATSEGEWLMMHNGSLPDVHRQLGLSESDFDTAEYLRYLVGQSPVELNEEVVRHKLDPLTEGDCGNAVLTHTHDGRCRSYVIQWYPVDSEHPTCFNMHTARVNDATYIASEIIPELAPTEMWRALKRVEVVTLDL